MTPPTTAPTGTDFVIVEEDWEVALLPSGLGLFWVVVLGTALFEDLLLEAEDEDVSRVGGLLDICVLMVVEILDVEVVVVEVAWVALVGDDIPFEDDVSLMLCVALLMIGNSGVKLYPSGPTMEAFAAGPTTISIA